MKKGERFAENLSNAVQSESITQLSGVTEQERQFLAMKCNEVDTSRNMENNDLLHSRASYQTTSTPMDP